MPPIRVLRVIDLEGACIAELSHGAGHGISPSGGWSPVAGDARYLAVHDREDLERPLIFDAKTGSSTEIKLALPGETFDSQYVSSQLNDHRETLALFEQEARSGQDPELKAFAEKGIPVLEQHIAELEKLQKMPELQ